MFEAHFQTFEEPESGVALTARLGIFREELARRKLTGFVIPRADQQQNEYVAASEERLAWLTRLNRPPRRGGALRRGGGRFVARPDIRCRPQTRSTAGAGTSSRWPIRRRNTGWPSISWPATAS